MENNEFLKDLKTALWVRWYNFKDFLRTAYHYYKDLPFAKIDMGILFSFFFKSPYRLSREYAEQLKIPALEVYGETPLPTMEKIAKEAEISANDVVYELGSGRGRCSFWLVSFIHCRVVGVEIIAPFVHVANEIKKRYREEKTSFILANMFEVDLTPATVIYLYGTLLSDEEIKAIAKKFSKLHKGTKIITISYPLQEYYSVPCFELIKCFEVEFPWGTTTAYVQKVK